MGFELARGHSLKARRPSTRKQFRRLEPAPRRSTAAGGLRMVLRSNERSILSPFTRYRAIPKRQEPDRGCLGDLYRANQWCLKVRVKVKAIKRLDTCPFKREVLAEICFVFPREPNRFQAVPCKRCLLLVNWNSLEYPDANDCISVESGVAKNRYDLTGIDDFFGVAQSEAKAKCLRGKTKRDKSRKRVISSGSLFSAPLV